MGAAISWIGANLDKIGLVYQLVETGSVVWQSSSAPRFKEARTARAIFAVVSGTLGSLGLLFLMEGKLSLLSRGARIIPGLIIPIIPIALLGAGGLTVMTLAAVTILTVNRIFRPAGDLSQHLPANLSADDRKAIQVKWDHPSMISFSQGITAMRMVINLALAYFSANPYFFLATAALETLNVGLMARWKWIAYQRTFELKTPGANGGPAQPIFQDGPKKMILTYYCPVSPAPLCENHPHTEQSLVNLIHQKFHAFAANIRQNFFHKEKPNHERASDGQIRVKSFSYEVFISRESVPACDVCNKKPEKQEAPIAVKVVDSRFPEREQAATVKRTSQGVMLGVTTHRDRQDNDGQNPQPQPA